MDFLNNRLMEGANIQSAFVPIDLQTAANDGDWVSMKNYERCACVLFKAVGTAGDDPTITMEQATVVAGTDAKALTFTDIYTKQGALLTAQGTFTRTVQAAAATYVDLTAAELQAIWVIEFLGSDLDADNGFDCLRMRVADVGGNAQLGCGLYILYPAAQGSPPPSPIID